MNDVYRISADDRFAVRLGARHLRQMLRFCRKSGVYETGGILIGHYDEQLRCAVVTRVTGPPSGSEHKRYTFYRAVGGLQKLLDRLWNGGKGYYLGEWHFHPGGTVQPSPDDCDQMSRIAQDSAYSCPEPLLVIIAGFPDRDWKLGVTIFLRSGGSVGLSSPST